MSGNGGRWHGQHGTVLLGPTEDRIARYLAWATDHGLVTLRTVDIAARLNIERSEAYRVIAHLRVLGLFGVDDDKSGKRGGRRIWRTSTRRPGPVTLDPVRHRLAWARITAWRRAQQLVVAARLATVRDAGAPLTQGRPALGHVASGGPTFTELFRRAGGGPLLDGWGVRAP